MILDADRLVAWYPHFARRHRRVNLCDPAAARQAYERAAALTAGDAARTPAAVFLTFAESRRAEAEVLDRLCLDVLHRRAGWDEVQAWFEPRLTALPR